MMIYISLLYSYGIPKAYYYFKAQNTEKLKNPKEREFQFI